MERLDAPSTSKASRARTKQSRRGLPPLREDLPCYEHLRFDVGDGEGVNFERLLVPYSEHGARVTHLAGMAIFSGATSGEDAK